jgi:pyruvate/2-oxoacid:ferredoxin oxidoreductase alpha subunit
MRKDAYGILVGKRLLQDRKTEGRRCQDYSQEDGQTAAVLNIRVLLPFSQNLIKTLNQAITVCTTRFNIQQFHVLSMQCIYVVCVDLRTNSDYFPIQH